MIVHLANGCENRLVNLEQIDLVLFWIRFEFDKYFAPKLEVFQTRAPACIKRRQMMSVYLILVTLVDGIIVTVIHFDLIWFDLNRWYCIREHRIHITSIDCHSFWIGWLTIEQKTEQPELLSNKSGTDRSLRDHHHWCKRIPFTVNSISALCKGTS